MILSAYRNKIKKENDMEKEKEKKKKKYIMRGRNKIVNK